MQAPGDTDEDRSEGFEHGGWQMPYFDEAAGKAISEGMTTAGGFLLGRRTYELFAGFWPTQPDDDPIAATLNNLPKYVASTTLAEPLEWRNATLLKGDVAEAVATLKRQPGKDLHVIGSGELAQTLMRHDLVDEYRLMLEPILLGGGKRLFPDDGRARRLELVSSAPAATGVLICTYRPVRT
jgi:dihydrofolate reductase